VNLLTLVTALTGLVVSTPKPIPSPAPALDLVVEKSAAGPAAAALLFAELEAHLEDGYAITGLDQDDDGIEIVFSGSETVQLRATVDAVGHVLAVEVASRPGADSWARGERGMAMPTGLSGLGAHATLAIGTGTDGPALAIRTGMGEVISLGLGGVVADEICGG